MDQAFDAEANDVGDPFLKQTSPETHLHKILEINEACRTNDLRALQRLASTSHGFVNDATRRTAWPLLLGAHEKGFEDQSVSSWTTLPRHRDEPQVKLDVDRSFVYYPLDESEKQIDRRKESLQDLIVGTLRRFPYLHYFQGYHDIVQVFLLVLGADAASAPVARLSVLRIRDCMLPSLSGALAHLQLLGPILRLADKDVASRVSITHPFFALPATLTLYAHQIERYADIARLFDFLLAESAVIPVYVFAAIILSRKKELIEIGPDEPDMLHAVLSKLPQPLDLDALITRTLELYQEYPPASLAAWRRIDKNSTLKTAQDPLQLPKQTFDQGHRWFELQVTRMQREQMIANFYGTLLKYRKPASTVGIAVVVGVLAWWLRKESLPSFVDSLWQHAIQVLRARFSIG